MFTLRRGLPLLALPLVQCSAADTRAPTQAADERVITTLATRDARLIVHASRSGEPGFAVVDHTGRSARLSSAELARQNPALFDVYTTGLAGAAIDARLDPELHESARAAALRGELDSPGRFRP